ncbi:MAG: GTP-binding protein [Lachnospiraceae bacterium]|jgi:G3E family GTPase|nr:GTP-binding protein [Lachnospiraceae bacterium]MCH4064324.1 GTP-binding protein [Lachnospiraceae bacterium]MCH4102951.1 GTP-binding protein [Lachnospiraceae bacterium]MCI1308940.1 GTP-binding protein [Lachnospiraceae bacterium]MCI1333430.1 GTP-binding protein [Lachnospiraceae bacterium]
MVKVDIISGFLGAGKTTLIKELLEDALKGQQIVLIENEFGEIGIDGGFLKNAGIEIREMNSGCICCSLVGDFGQALKEVAQKYKPDRIIIEPSGVGKLSDVIHAVERVKDEAGVVVNSATTVVDVLKCGMYMKNFGEFFRNQVESAGTIILSRMDTDKAARDTDKVSDALKMIRELNPTAVVITTPVSVLGGKKVLDTMENGAVDLEKLEPVHEHHDEHDHEHDHHDHEDHEDHDHEHDHHDHEDHDDHDHDHDEHDHHDHDHCHHHHHADEVFDSWGRETPKKFTEESIRGILKELSDSAEYGTVLRAKGMVEGEDGRWIYFDMVPEEADVRSGEPEFTGRICVIGAKLNGQKLEQLFGLDED